MTFSTCREKSDSDLGYKQKALQFYNESLPLRRSIGDKAGEARTLNNIGKIYSDLGNQHKALQFYNDSLALRRQVGDKAGEARTLNNIGKVYSDLGNQHKALQFYNESMLLVRVVGDKAGEAMTFYNIAYLERDRGRLNSALANIEGTIQIIEDLRTKIDSQELRSSYFESHQDVYQSYIDLLMQLHKKDSKKLCEFQIKNFKIHDKCNIVALHISERARARVLLELLTEARASIRKGASPALLELERDISQQIEARKDLMLFLESQEDIVAKESSQRLKKEIENLSIQYDEVVTKIRTTSPKYASLIYPEPLVLKQMQQQLDKDTLLLQYSLGKERSYLWAVTPDSIQSYELPKSKEIEAAVEEFRNALTDKLPIEQPAKIRKLNKLSRFILAPVADKLEKKRLVIVADGGLQLVPFAALQTPGSKAYQPLIINHEIVNLPSVTSLAIQRKEFSQREMAPKTLAVLADPVFKADDERLTNKPATFVSNLDIRGQLEQSTLLRAAKNLKRNGWERLLGTEKEAQTILELEKSEYNKIQAFSFDANYDWATNKQLKEYRFLHFATHGFADPINPQESGIVLSLIDKQGYSTKQGYLRLADIFNLDFGAELVVLSACETGVGKDVKGEGIIALTRGLMYAGSPRAVVSLWNVDDEGTSILMGNFYKLMLQQGLAPAAAMRMAQLKMWQQGEWQDPYYWASFTMQGEWR